MNNTSLPPRPIIPIVVPVEDEPTHVAPYYFCSDPSCGCHNDPELTRVLQAMVDAEEVTPAQALVIYWNQQ